MTRARRLRASVASTGVAVAVAAAAKLYTKGHVRADRWYKLWRRILYGSLEDEHRSRPGAG